MASHQPPATSHQPPATSHQPPATSHQPPATSHQPPATATSQPPTTATSYSSHPLSSTTPSSPTMQDYNTIPNEIFVEIFSSEVTNIPFLSSISLVNRRFRFLVEPILYKDIWLPNNHALPSAIQRFLHTILSRPILATYVRLLGVDWVQPSRAVLGATSDPDDLRDLRLFSAAAASAGLLHSMESQGAQVALLMHLLPNLHTLKVFYNFDFDPDIFDIMLAEYAVLPIASLPIGLRYLQSVWFGVGGGEVSPKALLTILKLPYIREIYLHTPANMDEIITTSATAAAFATGKSLVTDLQFGYGSINTLSLARILGMTRTLTRFSYTDCDGSAGSFKCAVFGMALRQFRGTLRELVLRFRWAMDLADGDEPGTLGSLRDWPVLKKVRCSVTALVGRAGMGGVVRLREVLPVVVGRVVVDVDGDWVDGKVIEQMVDVVEGGEFRCLEEVIVAAREEGVEESGASLREACESTGVVLMMYMSYGC